MFCNQTKEFLSRRRVQFRERNVVSDPDALQELRQLGYMTTPVIVIDRTTIVGFDEAKITAALEQQ